MLSIHAEQVRGFSLTRSCPASAKSVHQAGLGFVAMTKSTSCQNSWTTFHTASGSTSTNSQRCCRNVRRARSFCAGNTSGSRGIWRGAAFICRNRPVSAPSLRIRPPYSVVGGRIVGLAAPADRASGLRGLRGCCIDGVGFRAWESRCMQRRRVPPRKCTRRLKDVAVKRFHRSSLVGLLCTSSPPARIAPRHRFHAKFSGNGVQRREADGRVSSASLW